MIAMGVILILIGAVGYSAAENYEVTFEEQLVYIFDGTKPQNYDLMQFFSSYGILIVVLGGIFLIIGILMFIMQRPRYYLYPIEPDRILNHPLIQSSLNPLTQPSPVTVGPWCCPECGANNSSSNVYCSVCGTRKD